MTRAVQKRMLEWDWFRGTIPENVQLAPSAYVHTTFSFTCFRSKVDCALDVGEGASIYNGVMFDLGPNAHVTIGRYALLNAARIICDRRVEIGDYALISWNVLIMDSYRFSTDPATRRHELHAVAVSAARLPDFACPTRPVRLESNVWIGFDTCIMPGVTVGEGSIVGARSVVTTDVPPYTVVAGNPAKVINRLAHGEIIASVP